MDMSVYVYVGVCLQQEKNKLQQKKKRMCISFKNNNSKGKRVTKPTKQKHCNKCCNNYNKCCTPAKHASQVKLSRVKAKWNLVSHRMVRSYLTHTPHSNKVKASAYVYVCVQPQQWGIERENKDVEIK